MAKMMIAAAARGGDRVEVAGTEVVEHGTIAKGLSEAGFPPSRRMTAMEPSQRGKAGYTLCEIAHAALDNDGLCQCSPITS